MDDSHSPSQRRAGLDLLRWLPAMVVRFGDVMVSEGPFLALGRLARSMLCTLRQIVSSAEHVRRADPVWLIAVGYRATEG